MTTAPQDDVRPPLSQVTVLLVEDDDADAFLVQEILDGVPGRPSLIRVHSVAAAARVDLADIDCVLLDLGLPDALGLEALRRLLDIAGRIPIIVLTGQHDDSLGEQAVAAGAQDFLGKTGVTGSLLARTVRYAVQRRRTEEIEAALLEERLHSAENARLERGLLPKPVRGAGTSINVTLRYRPGGGRMLLGGDFYDVITDDRGATHVLIGDVCGHGPDQAALGVALRIAWRTLVLSSMPDVEILPIIHRVLVNERPDDVLFATVCTVTIEPGGRRARMFLAGHPAPLLYADARWTTLAQNGGPALGLLKDARWIPQDVELPEPPWNLMLYTDGAIEGHIDSGEDRLGADGLVRLLNRFGDSRADPGLALDEILGEITVLNGGALPDDVALVLLALDESTTSVGPGDAHVARRTAR